MEGVAWRCVEGQSRARLVCTPARRRIGCSVGVSSMSMLTLCACLSPLLQAQRAKSTNRVEREQRVVDSGERALPSSHVRAAHASYTCACARARWCIWVVRRGTVHSMPECLALIVVPACLPACMPASQSAASSMVYDVPDGFPRPGEAELGVVRAAATPSLQTLGVPCA